MTPAVKGVTVAGGAVGGGYGIKLSLDIPDMPKVHHTLFELTNLARTYASGKLGAYSRYFVDPNKKDSQDKNKNWWEWSFRHRFQRKDKSKLSA